MAACTFEFYVVILAPRLTGIHFYPPFLVFYCVSCGFRLPSTTCGVVPFYSLNILTGHQAVVRLVSIFIHSFFYFGVWSVDFENVIFIRGGLFIRENVCRDLFFLW